MNTEDLLEAIEDKKSYTIRKSGEEYFNGEYVPVNYILLWSEDGTTCFYNLSLSLENQSLETLEAINQLLN